MSLISTLGEKPWLDKSTGDDQHYIPVDMIHAKRIALNIFLSIVTVLFSLFVVTFLARSQYPDFQALAGDVWQPFYDSTRLWLNTFLLFVSSALIQTAVFLIRRNRIQYALLALSVSLLFALQFLAAQFMLWQHLQSLGYYVASNPANSYFYIFTAIHGLHLVGGLLVLIQALFQFWQRKSPERLRNTLFLCTRYWHYLFVLWLVLFALMTSSPETYETLAALCGY